ncbi:hypothetical protein CRUP_002554 [Coryphaenoides rupestris]|nr:hypothetical protein CRUP_002554 [Coryphaenoides rupestris]
MMCSAREKVEDQLEREARYRQLMAHSSHDSAIDTDSMEWETEVKTPSMNFLRENFSKMFKTRGDFQI